MQQPFKPGDHFWINMLPLAVLCGLGLLFVVVGLWLL